MVILADFECADDADVPPEESFAKPRFHWLSEHDVMAMPAPSYVVDNWLVENTTTLIYAKQRSLKSFFVLDLGLCISHGIPFHGSNVRQGAFGYVCGEGSAGIGKRIAGWRAHHQIAKDTRSPMLMLNRAVKLTDENEVTALIHNLHALECEFEFKLQMLGFDTVSKALAGGKEDDEGIGKLLANVDRIRDELQCCVVLVHHAGKDVTRGARGSSLLECNTDAVYRVDRRLNDPQITISADKLKDAEDGWSVVFDAERVELPHHPGKPGQTTLVLNLKEFISGEELRNKAREQVASDKAAKVNQKNYDQLLEIVNALWEGSDDFWSLPEVCDKTQHKKGGYYATIRALIPLDGKKLVTTSYGDVNVWREDTLKGEFVHIEHAI